MRKLPGADKDGATIMDKIRGLLRGLFIPRKGSVFVPGDFAGIELRGLMYLAGCKRGLAEIRKELPVYKLFAAQIFNKRHTQIEKGTDEYILGKETVLGRGYGMGDQKFISLCYKKYGMVIKDTLAARSKELYHEAYPEIRQYWRDCEQAFTRALVAGSASVGTGNRLIKFELTAKRMFMRVTFPSGSTMFYYRPHIVTVRDPNTGEPKTEIRYFGPRGIKRIWGGVIVENIVQRYAFELLGESMLETEKSKLLNLIFTVHDEIVPEAKRGAAARAVKELTRIMETAPAWAPGFPLKAEIAVMERYGKAA